jgi:hypothetical protein
LVRQPTPPSCFAGQRAPTRERQLPVTTSPDRQPAEPRIEHTDQSRLKPAPPLATPPTRSAKLVRQPTPPSCFAGQRAPTRERQLPMTTSPDRQPAEPRIEAYRSVAPQTRTATGDTANEVRQVGPPTDTAKLLRRSESANQRAPTAGDHLPPPATCQSSHRSRPISRASNPHRHWRHRQRDPPSWSAIRHRQVASPVRERQTESSNCR